MTEGKKKPSSTREQFDCVNSLHLRSDQGFPARSIWLTLTAARAASSVHRPSERLLQTPILLPITTEVISGRGIVCFLTY